MTETQKAAMQQALEALKAGDRYIDMLEFEMSCEQPETFYYKGPHRDREKVQAAIADLEAIIAALAEPETELVAQCHPFVVRHYISDERPILKGNGFDGLEIGADREEAERFVAWVNARITTTPARQPLTDDQRGGLVMEHLDPAALTGGTMSVYEAFLAAPLRRLERG